MIAEPITVDRTYDEICEESRTYGDVSDAAAWKIGDNAIEVMARWGDPKKQHDESEAIRTLADYARNIRKPKGTVYEAHKMCCYWSPQVRNELFDTCPNISRSHMRKVLSIKDVDQGRWLIEKCSDKGWTVDQFGYILKRWKRMKGIGKQTPPKPIIETFEAELWRDGEEGHEIFLADSDWNKLCAIADKYTAVVTVTVTYEAKETQS